MGSRKIAVVVAIICTISILNVITLVDAKKIYVNETGWWTDGSQFTANTTPIQNAVDNANIRDIIEIQNGSYLENLVISKNLTIAGNGTYSGINITAKDIFADLINIKNTNGVSISNFTITSPEAHFGEGISIDQSDNVTVSGMYINDTGDGIYVNSSNNVTIIYNRINQESSDCIELKNSNHSTIFSNEISSKRNGIKLQESYHNTLRNNTINSTSFYGIAMSDSNGNKIFYNIIDTNDYGLNCIDLLSSNENTIYGNTLNSNRHGIQLSSSYYNSIVNNRILTSRLDGLYLFYSHINTFNNNYVANSENGVKLYGSSNNELNENTIKNNEFYGVFLQNSDNNTFLTNTLYSNNCGVCLLTSDNNSLSLNNVLSNKYGLNISANPTYVSSRNTVSNNNFTNTLWDFYVVNGSENIYSNNNISTNLISINAFGDYALKGTQGSNIPQLPEGWIDIGSYVKIKEISQNPLQNTFTDVQIDYGLAPELQEPEINEKTIKIWKYNDSWYEDGWYSSSTLYPEINIVGANITEYDNATYFVLARIPQTIYVNETGWWTDGSQFTANTTPIQNAVDNANIGDTIKIQPGYYLENILIDSKDINIVGNGLSSEIILKAKDNTKNVVKIENACNITISNMTLTGATDIIDVPTALYLEKVNNSIISSLNISGNYIGICLKESRENTLDDLLLANNTETGLLLWISENNSISGISSVYNGFEGVMLHHSNGNVITNSSLNMNLNGISVSNSNYNLIKNNLISYNQVEGGIIMGWSKNNIIEKNDILSNSKGISLTISNENNTITKNEIETNEEGVIVYQSNTNTNILDNLITSNGYGIRAYAKQSIKDNVFINNTLDLIVTENGVILLNNTFNTTVLDIVEYYGDFSIVGIKGAGYAGNPNNLLGNGEGINITKKSLSGFMNISIKYRGYTNLFENTQKLWKFNQSTWLENGWSGSRVYDFGNNTIGVNITEMDYNSWNIFEIFGIENKEPVALFSISDNPIAGKETSLDAFNSYDTDNNITNYVWELGDGSNATGVSIKHIYQSKGEYTITLTVFDEEGSSNTIQKSISVGAQTSGEVKQSTPSNSVGGGGGGGFYFFISPTPKTSPDSKTSPSTPTVLPKWISKKKTQLPNATSDLNQKDGHIAEVDNKKTATGNETDLGKRKATKNSLPDFQIFAAIFCLLAVSALNRRDKT